MRYAVVLPFIIREFRDECLAGCRFDGVLEVDNTETNRGVMRSHNLGIDHMRAVDADWLLILSAAVRFGPSGGLDFIHALETSHARAQVVNAVGLFGWHLMAFSRETVELAGRWDENFTPYGLDDNDYAIRIHKSQPKADWWGVTGCEVGDTMMGHSVKLAGVQVDNEGILEYFRGKWGDGPGPPFESYYDRPWNDPANDVGFWPAVNGATWDGMAP